MNPVVTWLESDEGEAWRQRNVSSLEWQRCTDGWLAGIRRLPGEVYSGWMRGPVDPAHDPCGRPPARGPERRTAPNSASRVSLGEETVLGDLRAAQP